MFLKKIALGLSAAFVVLAIVLTLIPAEFGGLLGGKFISGLGLIIVLYCITATITRIATLYGNINSMDDMKNELEKIKDLSFALSSEAKESSNTNNDSANKDDNANKDNG